MPSLDSRVAESSPGPAPPEVAPEPSSSPGGWRSGDPRTRIVAVATRVPRPCGAQEVAARFQERVLERVIDAPRRRSRMIELARRFYEASGIRTRHGVIDDFVHDDPGRFRFFPQNWDLEPFPSTQQRMRVYERESVPLATEAARAAIDEAGISPDDVTHLLIGSCTGFFAPGPDVLVARNLGLPPCVERTLVGYMGCHAGLVGMRLADRIVRSNPEAVVLQIQVELGTIHFQRRPEPGLILANALFADGSAAAVYTAEGRGSAPGLGTVVATRSETTADSLDQMTWRIGDHGFEMHLAPAVPDTLRAGARRFVTELLSVAGLRGDGVDRWAIHPGGPRILDGLQEALALGDHQLEPGRRVLRRFGNMSSATIFFVLEEALRGSGAGPLVVLAFGPGLTMEGVLLDSAPETSHGTGSGMAERRCPDGEAD